MAGLARQIRMYVVLYDASNVVLFVQASLICWTREYDRDGSRMWFVIRYACAVSRSVLDLGISVFILRSLSFDCSRSPIGV